MRMLRARGRWARGGGLAATLLVVQAGITAAQTSMTAETAIRRLDPRLDALVPRDAALERVASGFTWIEGPLWDAEDGSLLFSDIPSNSVYRVRPGSDPELVLRPSGYTGRAPFPGREPGSNGLLFDPHGRLVLLQHGDRRVARLGEDGRFVPLAERYEGRRLNSPNDAILAPGGDILFTDPPFGLPGAYDDPGRELPFQGVFRLAPDGTLTLLTDALRAPNGLALSPDGGTLYVSNADRADPVVVAFDVLPDGSLANRRVFLRLDRWVRDGLPGAPDGMEIDESGNLYVAGPGGLHVVASDGTELGVLWPGATTSNAAWGDDGYTLYLTASDAVWRVRLATRGAWR